LEHRARLHQGLAQRWLAPLTGLTMALLDRDRPELRLNRQLGVCADFAMRLSGIVTAQGLLELWHGLAEAHAKAFPQDALAQRDLSVSQSEIGDFHQRRGGPGDAERALVYFQASLTSRERLARDNAQDALAQRDLSVLRERLGDFYRRRGAPGDADLALGFYQASLETLERLARDNPQDALAQRDLSVSQSKLGDFHQHRGSPGDSDLALGFYQASLATGERLARDNPQDALAQRDLSVSQSKLGDFHQHRGSPGDSALALGFYQASLATAEWLARENPQDGEAQRDLAISQERLGDFHQRRGGPADLEAALGYFDAAAVTRQRLVAANPAIGELRAELSVPLMLLLFALAQLKREEDAQIVARALEAQVDEWDAIGFESDRRIEGARDLLRQLRGEGDTT